MNIFLWLYDNLKTRHWLVATIWALLVVASVVIASHIRLKEDISDFITTDEETERYTSVFQQMGGQQRIVIVTSAPGLPKEERTNAIVETMDDFTTVLEEVDTEGIVQSVNMQVDESIVSDMMDFVVEHAPLFLQESDYTRMDSLLLQPDFVQHSLEEDRQLLLLPTGGMLTSHICQDPLYLFSPLLTRMMNLRNGDGFRIEDEHIFTPSHDAGIGFLQSPFGASESRNNRRLGAMLDTVCMRLMQQHEGIRITAIGAPLIAVSNAERIKADGLLSGSLSVLLILGLLLYVFRRLDAVFWILLSIATGYAIAIAVIGLYRGELSIIVLGTSSVIIGIAANYPLHFLDHLRHESNRRQALRDMIPPLLTGNITTVSAFACLAWMDSAAMQDLGLIGAFVLVGTILFVLVVLPLFVAQRKWADNHIEEEVIQPSHPNLVGIVTHVLSSGWIFSLVLLLTGLFALLSLRTQFDTNIQHINYMTPDQKANLNLLGLGLESANGTNVLAMTEDEDLDMALQQSECLVDTLRSSGLEVKGITGFLPSRQAQKKAIALWKGFVSRHGERIKKELAEYAPQSGFSKSAFIPFLTLLDNPIAVQPADYFSPITNIVGDQFMLYDSIAHKHRVVNYIHTEQPMTEKEKDEWRTRFHTCGYIFDSKDTQSKLANTLSDNFNYIGFVCGFVVFFFLWFSFGSIELSLLSFVPLAVSWVWILGLMQLFGIQFNIVNIILATFIFGQGDDYTIFITEGLIHEYTYGKKILRAYRNSVALSALIMFIGIGTLIVAHHPAMRSLAEVVIVGMFTVVLMAYYLPPILFRWVTREHGKLRQVPLTMQRFVYSMEAFLFFLVCSIPYQIFAFVYSHLGRYTEEKKLFFHRTLCAVSRFCINHVPGTQYSMSNPHDEKLEKPAIIICNHQSQLDLMAVLSIAPKVAILTKKWVWNNPFYGLIIRAAEFYPASDGIEKCTERLGNLIGRGYSVVVFPEGTRSKDCQIHRFHQGAFHLAKAYNVDILPVFLHGLGHVLPKGELSLRKGHMHMEIGKRISTADTIWSLPVRNQTKFFHSVYIEHYKELCRKLEKTEAILPYVAYQYKYKGLEVERKANKQFRSISRLAKQIDEWSGGNEMSIENCGQGELAFVFALVHPDVRVIAMDADENKIAIARNININAPNLSFMVKAEI